MRNVVLATAVALLLVGCGANGDATDSTTTSVNPTSTSTTVAPTTTSSTSTSTTTTTAETTTTVDAPLIGEEIPPAETLDWEMWAVYVFLWEDVWDQDAFEASGGAALLDEVRAHATALGYDGESLLVGDLSCDPGAHELLELDPRAADYGAAALYFVSEEDAEAVADAFEPYTVGYGFVNIGCAD